MLSKSTVGIAAVKYVLLRYTHPAEHMLVYYHAATLSCVASYVDKLLRMFANKKSLIRRSDVSCDCPAAKEQNQMYVYILKY